MSQTIIGFFSNIDQAEDAKSYLLSNGFANEDIDINTNAGTYYLNQGITGQKDMNDNLNTAPANIAENNDDANTHIAAGRKGVMVTVYTKNSDEALEASEVLINYGALDVNDPIGYRGFEAVDNSKELPNPDSHNQVV